MKTKEFDEYFDNGGSVMPFADLSKAQHPNQITKRISVDFPRWLVKALDREAQHLGVTRQALVKFWIANCLTHEAHTARR